MEGTAWAQGGGWWPGVQDAWRGKDTGPLLHLLTSTRSSFPCITTAPSSQGGPAPGLLLAQEPGDEENERGACGWPFL